MILTPAEIISIVEQKTGKTVDANNIELICGGASSVDGTVNVETPDETICYACKVECVPTGEDQIVFESTAGTELSINAAAVTPGYRSYDLVIFNKINGAISDDTEIHFTGYKFNLYE